MQILRLPNLWLMLSLLLLLLVSPFLVATGFWLQILFSLFLLSAVYVARHRRLELIGMAGFALLWLLLSLTGLGRAPGGASPFADGVLILLCVLTLVLVFTGTFSAEKVTADTLFGAVSIYLLMGITWAVTFRFLEFLEPNSFQGLVDAEGARWSQFLYLSLTTLTTLGYGDITPLSDPARVWANLEAITGVLYVAILVARLVSIYKA